MRVTLPALIESFNSEEQVVEEKPVTVTENKSDIGLPQVLPNVEKLLLPPPPFSEKINTEISTANSKANSVSKEDDCGEYWTEWTAVKNKVADPCPENCQKGKSLETEKRLQGFPPKPERKHKFLCVKSSSVN